MSASTYARDSRDGAMLMARTDRTLGLKTVESWVLDARTWNWCMVRARRQERLIESQQFMDEWDRRAEQSPAERARELAECEALADAIGFGTFFRRQAS